MRNMRLLLVLCVQYIRLVFDIIGVFCSILLVNLGRK